MSQDSDGAVDQLLKVLERLPFVGGLRRDIGSLRAVLYARRAPRVMVLGRPGSGRSRLANALLGKDALPIDESLTQNEWIRVDAHGARIDWMEVMLGAHDADVDERLARSLGEAHPDIVLLAVAPRDVNHDLGGLLDEAAKVQALVERMGETPPPLVALLTRADEIPPARTEARAWPDEKLQAIDVGRQRLETALGEHHLKHTRALAVAAPVDGHDGLHLHQLTESIFETLPEAAHLEGARALDLADEARRRVANRVVQSASAVALTVGLAPVPLSDAFFIAPLQVVMVSAVAHLGGRPWDRKAAFEWIASMGIVGGAGLGFRWGAQQLVKLVPGAGTLVSAGVAGAGTAALGQSAIAYFLRTGPKELPPG